MAADASETEHRPRLSRWLLGFLVVSLAGNLVFGGIYLGRELKRGERDPDLTRVENRLYRMVPDSHRAAAKTALLDRRGETLAAARSVLSANEGMIAALRADPFDPMALRAALDARTEGMRGYYIGPWESLLDTTADMSAAERSDLADAMQTAHARWKRRLLRRLE